MNTIYNRPLHEISPTSSRVAMLSTGNSKRKNIRYRSTKAIPPDTNSLHMKIKRSNMIAYTWRNFLKHDFHPLDARNEGREVKESNGIKRLVPIWYTDNPLPKDFEYDRHIFDKHGDVQTNDSSDSENSQYDSESDEYAKSDSNLSSDEEN